MEWLRPLKGKVAVLLHENESNPASGASYVQSKPEAESQVPASPTAQGTTRMDPLLLPPSIA
jgi:hypothetical protein